MHRCRIASRLSVVAGDAPEDNINPAGRLYYSASTMICVPKSGYSVNAMRSGLAVFAAYR
jgi:hypothetical protein